jgi:hypothetical protein
MKQGVFVRDFKSGTLNLSVPINIIQIHSSVIYFTFVGLYLSPTNIYNAQGDFEQPRMFVGEATVKCCILSSGQTRLLVAVGY